MLIEKIIPESIKKAVEILENGGTVVFPTETAYALGCDAINTAACRKIFKIKNRPKEKNLPVICATKKQVKKFFKMPVLAWKIWKKYWPKPVSVVMATRDKGQETREVPVRISSNKTARDLARGLGRPVVSTSANISGQPALYDAKKIAEIFAGKKYKPDLILDGGRLKKRKPSTIIKIKDGKAEVLRQGEARI